MGVWVLALLLALAAPVAAQDAPPPQVVFIQEKSPAAAGLFSFIIPGGGQVYNGQIGKGLAFFGVGVLAAAVASSNTCTEELIDGEWVEISCESDGTILGSALFIGNSVFSIVHAVKTSKRLNAEARARVQPTVSLDGRVGLAVSIPVR